MEENLKQAAVDSDNPIIKIAIYGPECSGKTTLAKRLAEHFHTVYATEFARDYLQGKWNSSKQICEPSDLLPIAIGQTHLENEMLQKANQYLFADTCALVTKVFSDFYYNSCEPALEKAAKKHKYDLFFLTDIDVPWEQDDLRDRPNQRTEAFNAFREALIHFKKPFITLSGDAETRLKTAISVLEELEQTKELGLKSADFVQLHAHGINLPTVKSQLQILKNGTQKTILDRAAIYGDGIIKLNNEEFTSAEAHFDEHKDHFKLEKFVPASGAASRMFKFLTEFINDFNPETESINAYVNRKNATNLTVFLAGLEKFPFFKEVDTYLNQIYPDFASWDGNKKNYHFIKILLDNPKFDYCNKPKGILPFHKYSIHIATPIEEHLQESVHYASSNGHANIHFTVSESHQSEFEKIITAVASDVEQKNEAKIHTSFSYQDTNTDTVAVDLGDKPLRDDEGKLVLRPGGHGALLQNLNNLDADIVFVKNIDNVIQDHIDKIAFYKKALAGILIKLQQQIFEYQQKIDSNSVTEIDIDTITQFIHDKLNITVIEDFTKYTLEHKLTFLAKLLNRPLRVCGMVKNEGEPGGGPFWVRDRKGRITLQIVETSQIDMQNKQQAGIVKESTHFNPVDLVCAIKDFKGNKFDLQSFVDPESGFIVEKNKKGKELKAYELPGLWNGAMAKWITIFVEVPLITFNPVKTVNDLLKPAHQPQ